MKPESINAPPARPTPSMIEHESTSKLKIAKITENRTHRKTIQVPWYHGNHHQPINHNETKRKWLVAVNLVGSRAMSAESLFGAAVSFDDQHCFLILTDIPVLTPFSLSIRTLPPELGCSNLSNSHWAIFLLLHGIHVTLLIVSRQ